MTTTQFNELIKTKGEISEYEYMLNKPLFDAAEKDGLIILKRKENKITIGGKIVEIRVIYYWEPL